MSAPKKVSAPIRMSEELLKRVEKACQHTDLSQADILRLALKIGLSDLEAIDYDIDGELAKAARRKNQMTGSTFADGGSDRMSPTLNEEPVMYPKGARAGAK